MIWSNSTDHRCFHSVNRRYRLEMRRIVSWKALLNVLDIPFQERSGIILYVSCIGHAERTPSLVLYPDGRFFCYGCHYQGDVIDFAARAAKLRSVRAVKQFFAQFT